MSTEPSDATPPREAPRVADPPPPPPKGLTWALEPIDKAPQAEDPGDRGTVSAHLARATAYELYVGMVTGLGMAIIGFVGLGGDFQDLFLKLRPPAPVSGEVVQVTVSEEALYLWDPSLGRPEVTPRALLAEIVRFLDAAGARVVVLDILLDQPAADDDVLAVAARDHGAVVAAEKYLVTDPASGLEFVPMISPTYDGAIHGGFANLYEEDSVLSEALLVRGAPLVRRVSRAQVSGTWPESLVGSHQDDHAVVPSMPLLAAWLYRSGGEVDPGQLGDRLGEACSGKPLRCGLTGEDLGLQPLPTALHDVLPINYRGAERQDPLPTIRAAQILRITGADALMRKLMASAGQDTTELSLEVPATLRALIEDRLVVVGRADGVGTTGADRFITPYSFPFYAEADMTGLRIQAQIIDTLLSGRHLRQRGWWPSLLLGLAVAGAVVGTGKMADHRHFLLWLGVLAGVLGAAILVFRWTDGLTLQVGPFLFCCLFTLLGHHLRRWTLVDLHR